ncbi:MAG: hypothetical protein JO337_13535 [Acidimicrobiales bacterium]|nr:hypothetical protein [Acidimicrobiales bacterium]
MSAPAIPEAAAAAGSGSLLRRLAAGVIDEETLDVAVGELRRARRPVSLPGLLNALWFGRGALGGYDGAAFGEYLEGLPYFEHQPPGRAERRSQEAVPLGALVKVVIGGDEYWGEVIWKEGAHPLLDPTWVPGWLAGAPSGIPADGPPPADFAPPDGPQLLWERLVVDFECLGDAFVPSEEKLARERRLERRFDRYGHMLAEVSYTDGLDEADEVTFWAAWTARHHPQALAAAGVPAGPGVLAEAASVLAAALDTREDVRSFGPYYIDADLYARVVEADEADDGPLRRSVRGLAQLPHHEKVAWAAMSARIPDCADDEDLIGERWTVGVVCASLLTLDTLAVEAADGDWNGVHLRLDDLWQGGGLWRAEQLGTLTPVAADPAIALGLGWVAHTGGVIERVPAADEELELDDEDDDLTWELVDSDVTWTVHLTNADLDRDRLRLPRPISALVAAHLHTAGQSLILVLRRHDGDPETRDWSRLDDDGHLSVSWPLGVWAGTTMRVTWPLDSTIVTAETRLLDQPELVGDITYTHEFNLAVALAAAGLAERVSRTATIGQLVRAVVRRHGAVTEDGRVALPVDDVVGFCFGPHGETVPGYGPGVLRRAVLAAVAAMAAAGVAALEAGLVVVSDRITGAGRRADADLLSRFVEAQARRLRRAAYRHYVPATVVNLPFGHYRSAEKDAGWDEVAGTDYLPAALGPNQTWRRRHTRGQGLDPNIEAQLRRAKEAIRDLGADEEVTAGLDDAVSDPFTPPPPRADQEPGGPR